MTFINKQYNDSNNSKHRVVASFFWKPLMVVVLCIGLTSFNAIKHPFYLGVTELVYDSSQKNMNVSIRLFTSDLEDALKRTTQKKIDILNPKNKAEVDTVLFHYIKKRFSINVNAQSYQLHYIGYEKQEESIWTYLEITNVPLPQKMIIDNALLYDFIPQQVNIIHAEVAGIKKSTKLNHPKTKSLFIF